MNNDKIELIENQHKIIEKTIKRLKDIIINREHSSYNPVDILTDLIDYYKIHFFTEEIFLLKIVNTERYTLHCTEHNNFMEKLINLSETNNITVELVLSLEKWSTEHVDILDAKDLIILKTPVL